MVQLLLITTYLSHLGVISGAEVSCHGAMTAQGSFFEDMDPLFRLPSHPSFCRDAQTLATDTLYHRFPCWKRSSTNRGTVEAGKTSSQRRTKGGSGAKVGVSILLEVNRGIREGCLRALVTWSGNTCGLARQQVIPGGSPIIDRDCLSICA